MRGAIRGAIEEIYRAHYGHIDSKQIAHRKMGEIEDWLRNGDIDDYTVEELVQEWGEYDRVEIDARA